jgi:probable HAF family extracellular repeat protein
LGLLFTAGHGLLFMPSASHAAAPEVHAADAAYYTITDLGYFQARELDERPDLNRAGQVAAWQVVNQTRAVAVLISAGTRADLPDLPEPANSYAFGLNDRGDVVGMLESASDLRATQGFVYRNGRLQMLHALGGRTAAARCINLAGLIAGNALTAAHQVHAASWLREEARDLGTLPGGDSSRAFAVNERGEIVGEANGSANGKARAVIWSSKGLHELGLLPGGSFSSAQAINNGSTAVGYADDAEGQANAVRFERGGVQNLGTLGDKPSSALGINDSGSIVGSSAIAGGTMRAFLWRKGRMLDLSNLIEPSGWLLLSAYRINATGAILAYGFYQGRTHLCVLTPHRRDRATQ